MCSFDPRGQRSGSTGVTCALLPCRYPRVRSLPRDEVVDRPFALANVLSCAPSSHAWTSCDLPTSGLPRPACAARDLLRTPPPRSFDPEYLPGLLGPFDASWFARPAHCSSPLRRSSRVRAGLPLPPVGFASRRLRSSSPLDRVSDRIVHGLPPFRGFSPFVPLDPLGSSCPPCRWPGLAAGWLRGFELRDHIGPILRSPACGLTNGSVLVRARCSRVRAVAPLLVVFPLRGLP